MTSKMTLNSWLYLALSDLPEPVRVRLETEYRAHLLDSDSPDDVRGVLGDPAEVNTQLSKLYGSAELWSKWQQPQPNWTLVVHIFLAGMTLLGGWRVCHSEGENMGQLLGPVMVLLISGVLWGCTARLPLAKRQLLRSTWTVSAIYVAQWLSWMMEWWIGQGTPDMPMIIVYPLICLVYFRGTLRNYLRLDRTLRLVGKRN